MQQAGERYLLTGFGETWQWNALLFFVGWIVAGLAVPFAATDIFPRHREQVAAIGRLTVGTGAGAVMKWLFLGGFAGIEICLYLVWTF